MKDTKKVDLKTGSEDRIRKEDPPPDFTLLFTEFWH